MAPRAHRHDRATTSDPARLVPWSYDPNNLGESLSGECCGEPRHFIRVVIEPGVVASLVT